MLLGAGIRCCKEVDQERDGPRFGNGHSIICIALSKKADLTCCISLVFRAARSKLVEKNFYVGALSW